MLPPSGSLVVENTLFPALRIFHSPQKTGFLSLPWSLPIGNYSIFMICCLLADISLLIAAHRNSEGQNSQSHTVAALQP